MKKIVTAGIILCDNKILIAQRKKEKHKGLMWEFPGGKLEEGETLEECLKREIKEEFDMNIRVGKFFMESVFEYDYGTIGLNAFFAFCDHPHIHKLDSHEQYKWVHSHELDNYEFCPADVPIVDKLKTLEL